MKSGRCVRERLLGCLLAGPIVYGCTGNPSIDAALTDMLLASCTGARKWATSWNTLVGFFKAQTRD